MKIAYIIDLDGTLYDNSHRQHLIPADRSNTAGWVEFNCACADDVLREDMSDLVRSVLLSGREVIFLTGRGEAAGEQTMQRLLKDFNFIEQPTLIMRPMDCHTSAAEFKRDAVKRIRDSERWAGYDLIALEDDPSIVEVMRGMGVTVLHIDSKCCTVEKPHHNGMMNATDFLRGGLLSAHDQTDTAPAQFESLACEPVSEPDKLNDPVILDAYEIERFGIFSATECESGLLLQIEQFWFGTENCPQIGKENMVPKFALQAIINRLQAHCNSMGEDTLIDIFASSAAPQQEVKK